MFDRVLKSERVRQAAGLVRTGVTTRLAGVWGSAAAVLAAAIGRLTDRPVLFIAPHLDDADEVADDMEVLSATPAQLFPAWEMDLGADHVNDEVVGERLRVCQLLTQRRGDRDEPADLIVTPTMALLQPVPSRQALADSWLVLRRGDGLGPEQLLAWLVDNGFERVDQVDRHGEFARRGGIVDVFQPATTEAVRVEFFGDQVDSIRRVDLDTQRSTEHVEGCVLTGLAAGRGTDPARTSLLADYLPDETLVCMVEPAQVMELAGQIHSRAAQAGRGPAGLLSPEDVFSSLGRFALLEIRTFAGGPDGLNLGIRSIERLHLNPQEAIRELGQIADVADVWVYCETAAERDRFVEMLDHLQPHLAGRLRLDIGHVNNGFYWPDEALAVVGHHEVFHRYAKVRRIRRVRAGRPIESLLDLNQGDYVVHVAHGIAKFEGLRTLQRDGKAEEFLTLRFADDALLHVPVSKINLVQRYIGTRGRHPSLSKLGGTRWARQKEAVARAVRDLAAEMLEIQAIRREMPGIGFPSGSPWQEQFASEFLYTETPDQLSAMADIDADMGAPRPMDRLLCGDVGYGKTELAMRAAFRAAEAGRQVAVLVPTTVLADQHGRTFSERFADYPFAIEVLSRFRSGREQAAVIEALAAGRVDIVIGTHRLLSRDVRFADLGLLIIDEEQRFGVAHKEHLKRMRATVDVLTMTATPIPRTLHMALLGLRDISSLATAPLDRRAIHTEVRRCDEELIRAAILKELNRQGQAFFVHNRVFDIEPLAQRLRELVPEARVAVGHGQMPESRLEETMLRFVAREVDVLVCTTIIESGLDIPTANTMVIHDADRFGLAELHQLRGRIGRYKHRAYCYLLLPEDRSVSLVAAKRLKTIEEFSDLGAGFQIAMRDLEIRGAGNILGREQSGHIAAVGYELYCQLLEEAVRSVRGEPSASRPEVHVELGVDSRIPPRYIPSDRQRMEVYRRLVRCRAPEELAQLERDLADAYGPIGPDVRTLLDLAEARLLAARCGIDSIIRMDPDVIFTFRVFAAAKDLFAGAAGTVRLPDDHTVHWRPPPAFLTQPTLLRVLLNRLRDAAPRV